MRVGDTITLTINGHEVDVEVKGVTMRTKMDDTHVRISFGRGDLEIPMETYKEMVE